MGTFMAKINISDFVNFWQGKHGEKQDTQRFWMDLFQMYKGFSSTLAIDVVQAGLIYIRLGNI